MRVLNDHLAFKTDKAGLVSAVLPETKHAQGWTAVPFTVETATVLRSIGIEAPSPIRHNYRWKGQYKPFKHQLTTAEFFTLNRRAFCLNDMGTGKTMSALWAADYLKECGLVNRVLIISPLSTLDVVWSREIFTNFPGRTVSVLHGSAEKRHRLLAEPADFYVINHHGVAILAEALRSRTDIDLVILDEAAVFRNAQTKMWKVLRSLITPDMWCWGMTGSPTPQAPTDAYGIAKMIKPENLERQSFTRFKSEVMHQVSQFKWIPKRDSERAVARLLTPSLRFSLRDCVDLPETIVQYRHVEMTTEQKHHYAALLKDAVTQIKGVDITAVNAAVLFGKLIQAACGVIYGQDGKVAKLDFTPRLKEVEDIIDDCNEKVIVFVPLTGALHAVQAELKKKGYNCGLIEGATSKTERLKIFDEFQRGTEMKVLLANAAAMAHGISLTVASTIIWFAPAFSNEVYEQANARIVRPGQKNVTNIVNIESTKEERKIYEGLRNKKKFMETVLDIIKNN